jgi:hypothetical protein
LESKLSECSAEVQNKNNTIDSLKNQNAELEHKLTGYMQQLKDVKDALAVSEEQYNQHLTTHNRLTELYKVTKSFCRAISRLFVNVFYCPEL